MLGPPQLWGWLTREWIPLPASLAWALWRALVKARWSLACEWREAFLAFDLPGQWRSGEDVEAFFGQVATPPVLMELLAVLIASRQ
jgi:hypothetical protein